MISPRVGRAIFTSTAFGASVAKADCANATSTIIASKLCNAVFIKSFRRRFKQTARRVVRIERRRAHLAAGEERERRRQHEQRGERRQRQSADDSPVQWRRLVAALAEAERERQH